MDDILNMLPDAGDDLGSEGTPQQNVEPIGSQEGSAVESQGEQTQRLEPVQGQQAQSQVPNRENPERFEFWQSRASKYERELEDLRPVRQLLESRPELLLELDKKMREETMAQQRSLVPQPPTKPEKPANYNPESVLDPSSDSFKYRVAMDEYRDAVADYQLKLVEHERAQRAEAEERQRASEVQRQREMQARANLKAKGLSDLEVQDFMQTMMSPETWTQENLLALYRAIKGQRQPGRANALAQAARQGVPPPPIGAGGTPVSEEMSEDDAFSLGLFQAANRAPRGKR